MKTGDPAEVLNRAGVLAKSAVAAHDKLDPWQRCIDFPPSLARIILPGAVPSCRKSTSASSILPAQ